MERKFMNLHHLLHITDLSRSQFVQLLDSAQLLCGSALTGTPHRHVLAGKTVCTLFFEPSTRTRSSFQLAATRLGADVLNFDAQTSSGTKGETAIDTMRNLEAMGVNCFVVRTAVDGELQALADAAKPTTHFINAGDGRSNHPTQALLDMLSIRQHKGADFSALNVLMVGDILHSRVARSDLQALQLLGMGEIRVCGPDALLPLDGTLSACKRFVGLNEALHGVDVIMMLRLQHERMRDGLVGSLESYSTEYGLNAQRLALAKPDAIVMHPGPMNRGVEISSEVADGSQSVILEQVSNGVAMRMAVLQAVFEQ
jgi:aspartate carbamoyltransferase catalytic subunit